MKFRKKPIVVEARQWTGTNFTELWNWGRDDKGVRQILQFGTGWSKAHPIPAKDRKLSVYTMEGALTAVVGDWIIKGVHGEFYPCKPDIFAETYEEVSP